MTSMPFVFCQKLEINMDDLIESIPDLIRKTVAST
jgi:hypothetical protein